MPEQRAFHIESGIFNESANHEVSAYCSSRDRWCLRSPLWLFRVRASKFNCGQVKDAAWLMM
jgi:hypothetical protein